MSIADMGEAHQQEIGAIVLKDPAIDHMAMRMGGGAIRSTTARCTLR